MKQVRFAIAGCGRIAQRHAGHIEEFGKLVAVCDVVEERAKELGEAYDAAWYPSVDEMLEHETSMDVVSVCTPNWLHAEHTIMALQAGFHVLCEKPMAISSAECGKMITVAEKSNRRLFIVKQNRFNPPVVALKEAIDAGYLGRILSVQLNCFWNRNETYYTSSDWKGSKERDGGTLFTQFSHFIDILFWLLGDVTEVHAMAGNLAHRETIEFEDTGVVLLKMECGAIGSIHYTVNAHAKNMEGSITLFGEKGTVKVGGQYLNTLEYQDIEGFEIKDLAPSGPANEYGEYRGSMSNHDRVYQNVIEVLNDRGVVATVGFEGLKTVEIIEKIYDRIGQIDPVYELAA